jgi:hypothetical protein
MHPTAQGRGLFRSAGNQDAVSVCGDGEDLSIAESKGGELFRMGAANHTRQRINAIP